MKKKVITKGMLIALIAVFTVATGVISAVAYWAGTSQLSQESTLNIGQTEVSIVLGDPSGTNPVEWYEGTSATFEYDVALTGADDDVTVTVAVNTEAEADFDIKLYISTDGGTTWGSALANDGTDVVEDGDKVKVVVTLIADEKPAYSSATLTVTLA